MTMMDAVVYVWLNLDGIVLQLTMLNHFVLKLPHQIIVEMEIFILLRLVMIKMRSQVMDAAKIAK